MTVRKAIASYENHTIQALVGTVESMYLILEPNLRNDDESNNRNLESKKSRTRSGANDLQQAVFGLYQGADGIVPVEPVENVTP